MAVAFDARAAREALRLLPEVHAQESLDPPDLKTLYVPAQHAKALHIDASVVVGMRGAGKSWWTAVLASEQHRNFVLGQLPGSALGRTEVCVGFGLDPSGTAFPLPDTLNQLVDEGLDPLDLWLTVVLRHARSAARKPRETGEGSWRDRVRKVSEGRDRANAELTALDEILAGNQRRLLILFDAFDRLAADWDRVRKLTSAALQLGLRMRSRRAIRFKFFFRPDLEEDAEIWRFPDSSKLRHAKVDLTWTSADLYGLVFMHLGNISEACGFAAEFRAKTALEVSEAWTERSGVHLPPRRLARDASSQQVVIEGLADPYMGSAKKRGVTYTWVPLHLADALGRISPRSYLLAFKKAAEHTAEHRPDHRRALHFSAIQQGVVKASEIRVQEIAEDYPWVEPLLEAVRGATVPITARELSALWLPESLRRMKRAAGSKLPPRRYSSDPFRKDSPEALIDDLVELAVLYRTKDGRLNMPDIFRVGFGIRRKGGVKPPR